MTNQTEKEPIEQEISSEKVESTVEQPEAELQNFEGIDPLALATMRVQELETYIAEADKREQDIQLRARAEIENIRRRAEQDVEKAHNFALEKFSKDILNTIDFYPLKVYHI